MTRGRDVSCGGRSGSGSWSQRGGRVKVKGLRSIRVLPVKTSVELVQSVWKRSVMSVLAKKLLSLRSFELFAACTSDQLMSMSKEL